MLSQWDATGWVLYKQQSINAPNSGGWKVQGKETASRQGFCFLQHCHMARRDERQKLNLHLSPFAISINPFLKVELSWPLTSQYPSSHGWFPGMYWDHSKYLWNGPSGFPFRDPHRQLCLLTEGAIALLNSVMCKSESADADVLITPGWPRALLVFIPPAQLNKFRPIISSENFMKAY